ncbi:MAG: hypothetical protein ABI954_03230 [Pyrinomonadaceae bacterium]
MKHLMMAAVPDLRQIIRCYFSRSQFRHFKPPGFFLVAEAKRDRIAIARLFAVNIA